MLPGEALALLAWEKYSQAALDAQTAGDEAETAIQADRAMRARNKFLYGIAAGLDYRGPPLEPAGASARPDSGEGETMGILSRDSGLKGLKATAKLKWPTIPLVAKALRTLSGQMPVETVAQLLVAFDGAWEVVPGDVAVSGIHDHCCKGTGVVPGLNAQRRPRRFNSTNMAREMLRECQEMAVMFLPAQMRAEVTRAETPRAKRRAPPRPDVHPIGKLVSFHGVPGRVVGHATVEGVDGPKHVHLVEATVAVRVPEWGMTLSVAVVLDGDVKPWVPPMPGKRASRPRSKA